MKFVGKPVAAVLPSRKKVQPSAAPKARQLPARRPEPPGQFVSWVLRRAGLEAEDYRGEPLRRRLPACLRVLHAHTQEQARQILEQRPELLPAAVSSLLIGVTGFFRDAPVFESLRTAVLPELAARGRLLRVWSAGCSNGAELYSLAILLAQDGLLEVSGEKSFLLGSDCREDAIQHARAALYNSDDLREIDPSDRRRYFSQDGDLWRPISPLRECAHWNVADLGRRIEEGPWDVILWRNMAIYLKPEAAASVWRGLASALSPEGVLVVGKAEQPLAELALVSVGRHIYRSGCAAGRDTRRSGPRPTSHGAQRTPETVA